MAIQPDQNQSEEYDLNASSDNAKKTWITPNLIVLGSVVDLTAQGGKLEAQTDGISGPTVFGPPIPPPPP